MVYISETGERAVSGSDGRYSLPLAPGSYTVAVTFLGCDPVSGKVAVTAGQTTTHDFKLAPLDPL